MGWACLDSQECVVPYTSVLGRMVHGILWRSEKRSAAVGLLDISSSRSFCFFFFFVFSSLTDGLIV